MKRSGIWANDGFLKLWIGETISIARLAERTHVADLRGRARA